MALTDGSGNVTDRIEYSPYATTTSRSETNDTPFLYNGRYGVQTDANGLLYMRARYYNPLLGRFLNADPAGFAGGLNHYAYADGNPVSMMDPFGLCAQVPEDNSWYGKFDRATDAVGNAIESAVKWTVRTAFETMLRADDVFFRPGTAADPNPLPLLGLLAGRGRVGGGATSRLFVSADTIPAGWRISPYRVTAAGETFQHYSYLQYSTSLQSGLWANSYATRVSGLSGAEAQAGLALPHPIPPNAVYTITPTLGTPIFVNPIARPLFGQPGGLPEVRFMFGTQPGTVSSPATIH